MDVKDDRNSNKSVERILEYLRAVEKLAEEILVDKQEIIQLSTMQNKNREALRDLGKSNQEICWLTVGSVLIKHNLYSTRQLIEKDQEKMNVDLNKLRRELKLKINNLRDLEMQPPLPGLMLTPLSPKERYSLSANGLL